MGMSWQHGVSYLLGRIWHYRFLWVRDFSEPDPKVESASAISSPHPMSSEAQRQHHHQDQDHQNR